MSNEISKAYRHLELQNQVWLNQRVAWIVKEFGQQHIKQVECLLPTSKRLAEYRGGTDAEVIEYFKTITRDMGLDPDQIDFSIEDRLETDDGGQALGLYSELEDGRFSIAMAADQLSDPRELVATLVHELCHVHLLGHGRVDGQEHDQEPLTDLLCVFMGYGIIAANSVVHDRTEGLGAYSQWRVERQGYMSMSMFGYALALFARIRNEDGRQWRRFMRADVRDAFDHSLRYFQRNGLPDLSCVPDEFSVPILKVESTLQPPPTHALAPLYAYGEEPEIPEDATDYPANMSEVAVALENNANADEHENAAGDVDFQCIYCGATSGLSQVNLPAVGDSIVCGACLDSIEEGAREAGQVASDDERVSRLVGLALLVSIALVIALIIWFLVSGLSNQ